MSRGGVALRVVLLPVVVGVGVMLYGQALRVAVALMPVPSGGGLSVAVLISQGFLAATLNAALASYPLARGYGRAAPGVALLIVVAVLGVVGVSGVGFRHSGAPLAAALYAWELASLALLLVGGSWLAQRQIRLSRAMPSVG